MNKRIRELAREAGFYANPDIEKFEKFAELIIKECIRINNVETTSWNLPEYNLGMLEGYRRARENMSIVFGVKE